MLSLILPSMYPEYLEEGTVRLDLYIFLNAHLHESRSVGLALILMGPIHCYRQDGGGPTGGQASQGQPDGTQRSPGNCL